MGHVPVMAGEFLRLVDARPGQVLVDLTVGAGGHARAFLEATAPTGRVLASDRDEQALLIAQRELLEFAPRVRFALADSATALQEHVAAHVRADAVLLDLGVSSMQLDEPARGFSLRADGPLDMRMDRRETRTAADLLNALSVDALQELLQAHGVTGAGRLAATIVARRERRPFRSTGDLRELVEQHGSRRGSPLHPATRVFQALRVGLNRELELLAASLPLALELLAPGGVLAVLSFHSGEDGLVKRAFKDLASGGSAELLTRRAQRPERAECATNRRSRSARLRAVRRCAAPGAGP